MAELFSTFTGLLVKLGIAAHFMVDFIPNVLLPLLFGD